MFDELHVDTERGLHVGFELRALRISKENREKRCTTREQGKVGGCHIPKACGGRRSLPPAHDSSGMSSTCSVQGVMELTRDLIGGLLSTTKACTVAQARFSLLS